MGKGVSNAAIFAWYVSCFLQSASTETGFTPVLDALNAGHASPDSPKALRGWGICSYFCHGQRLSIHCRSGSLNPNNWCFAQCSAVRV
ncbi:hypothetical protein BJY00DRAFT_280429 [Aspergillus carlsbadensis]|nr:hypothetical protein BJY00DRAFT_280429 [Aspergillus carlsbadensis]